MNVAAHWAAAAYPAGSVLVAAWLLRWRARGWAIATLALQGAVAALAHRLQNRADHGFGFTEPRGLAGQEAADLIAL